MDMDLDLSICRRVLEKKAIVKNLIVKDLCGLFTACPCWISF